MRFVKTNNSLKIDANELLFMEGDAGNEMYIVKSGLVKIMKMEGNKMVTLAELGPGSIIGEMSLIDQAKRMATAKTVLLTELIVINRNLLEATYKKLPNWLTAIIKILVQRLRTTSQLKVLKDHVNSIPVILHVILQLSRKDTNQNLSLNLNALAREASLLYGLNEGSLKKVTRLLAKEGFGRIEVNSMSREILIINEPLLIRYTLDYLRSKAHSNFELNPPEEDSDFSFFNKNQALITKDWEKIIKENILDQQ